MASTTNAPNGRPPLVGIVMGSRSDWETMQHAAQKLEALGVPHEVRIVSAHRTPDVLFDYAATAQSRGLRAAVLARDAAGGDRGVERLQATRLEHGQRLARGGTGEEVEQLAVHVVARGHGVRKGR